MARKRRRHPWRWLIWLAAALLALVVAYLPASQFVDMWVLSAFPPQEALRVVEIDEQVRHVALGVFLAAWTFMFGAAVGSFLNVVAWRMPRGESIVSRPSHCPYCNTNIRIRDNLPVFGWLLLGGRCRTCRLPISPRYPIVEAILGASFLALAVAEVFTGGANLPGYAPVRFQRLGAVVTSPDWPLLEVFGYHGLLLGLLAAVSLIKFDRHALPWKVPAAAVALGIAGPAIWPKLHPVAWTAERPTWLVAHAWLERIDTGLVGLAAGGLLGLLIDAFVRQTFAREERLRRGWTASTPSLAIVGMFLGWQALVSTALLGAIAAVVMTLLSQAIRFFGRFPLAGCWALGALLQLCFWRSLDGLAWWPGSDTPWRGMLLAAAFPLALVATCARFLRRPPPLDYNGETNDRGIPRRPAEEAGSAEPAHEMETGTAADTPGGRRDAETADTHDTECEHDLGNSSPQKTEPEEKRAP